MKAFVMMIVCVIAIAMGNVAMGQTRSSVVTIYSDEGKGTGFFVTRNLIMTNHHVVCSDNPYENCDHEVVVDHRLYKVAGKVVASDQELDLALVFVGGSGPRPFQFCKGAIIGDEVEVWTYEYGRFKTREGVIVQSWLTKYITTTGLIAGNSGSPLIKKDGFKKRVAGVSKSTYTDSNKSIHVNEHFAKKFLDSYLVKEAVK